MRVPITRSLRRIPRDTSHLPRIFSPIAVAAVGSVNGGEIEAVSKKLPPVARYASRMANDAASSVRQPKFLAPSAIRETSRPVRPSFFLLIISEVIYGNNGK